MNEIDGESNSDDCLTDIKRIRIYKTVCTKDFVIIYDKNEFTGELNMKTSHLQFFEFWRKGQKCLNKLTVSLKMFTFHVVTFLSLVSAYIT